MSGDECTVTVSEAVESIDCPHCARHYHLPILERHTGTTLKYCVYCGMPLQSARELRATREALSEIQNNIRNLERFLVELSYHEEVVEAGWYVIAGKDIAHYYRPSGRSRCGRLNIGRRQFSLRHSHTTDFRPATDDDPRCSGCRMWLDHDIEMQETK